MKSRILVFLKNPRLGEVKTRLAATEGNEKALEMYLKLLNYNAEITREYQQISNAEIHVYYSSEMPLQVELFKHANENFVQIHGDLGEKMLHAFNHGIELGFEKQVIIGSDCAELTVSDFAEAFDKLNNHDVVFGPAIDGGYYLLGLTQVINSVFENKPWSTEQLYSLTKTELINQNKKIHELTLRSDVDTIDDWNRSENLIINQ